MERLRCQFCEAITDQFTILKCDHITCSECLWGQMKTSFQGINSIKCPCGQNTNFALSKSALSTAKITTTTSPRRHFSKPLFTEPSQISISSPSTPQKQRKKSKINMEGQGQLNIELQFLRVSFKKSIEEAQRNFHKIVENIKVKFDNLVKNIKLFWLEQIIESPSMHLLDLPRLLNKKYQKSVGLKVKALNDSFLEQLTSYRLQTQPERVHTCSNLRHLRYEKENLKPSTNCIEERKILFQNLESLKQQCKGIRKLTRKGQKFKFL